MADFKPTIVLDFDGVIHSYTSKWTGVEPTDPPVEGAKEFVEALMADDYKIVIQSTRASSENRMGKAFISRWLKKYDFPYKEIEITSEKVPAVLYVDDRACRFEGDFEVVFDLKKRKGRMFSTWVGGTNGSEEKATDVNKLPRSDAESDRLGSPKTDLGSRGDEADPKRDQGDPRPKGDGEGVPDGDGGKGTFSRIPFRRSGKGS
jgi:hypothetical protein